MKQPVENYRERASNLYENKKYREVIELLTDEILKTFTDAGLYIWRARAHYKSGDDENIIMLYVEKAIDIDNQNFEAYFLRGNAFANKSDSRKAISDFTKAIQLKPDFELAYNNRGIEWAEIGEYDKAILDFNKIIDFKPDYSLAYYHRAKISYSKGELSNAVLDYNKVIELNPNMILAYNNRSCIWEELGEFDKAISDLNKVIEIKPDYSEAHYNIAHVWAKKGEYQKAITEYTKAIELKSDYKEAYFNRAIIWHNQEKFDNALLDYSKAIELDDEYMIAYYNRGNVWSQEGDLEKAMLDYSKAIELDSKFARAYFNRGLLGGKRKNELEERIKDFETYLDLTINENDVWTKLAIELIKEYKEKIKDSALKEIGEITSAIKKLLLIKDGCITHYTSITVCKKLILEKGSKLRISEGSFLNDTSEGVELFKFLEWQSSVPLDDPLADDFVPKPFIGSFVSELKHNDLNLWRFYGKENGIEASGCALTIKMKELIEAINLSISNGEDKTSIVNNPDDFSFYKVAYFTQEASGFKINIPNSFQEEEKKLLELITLLKEKVNNYKESDRSLLEKYLNNIAYLFKSQIYKNENEIRLVIKGIEFEKKVNNELYPPRVYIELVNIRKLVEQITIGPKVERAEEWAAAFHYSYDGEKDEDRPKKIKISRIPYK